MVFCNNGDEAPPPPVPPGHNPYFNRWFSAIEVYEKIVNSKYESQSLF